MAFTSVDDPTIYFETELYSGSSSDVTMNALSFQPDWVWLKKRSGSGDNLTYDSVRGTNKRLTINGTDAEVDRSSNNDELKSFNSDGWTLGTFNSNITGAGSNCVSWNWIAGGSASSNSNGSITSSVSASTTAGFSIVSYTGNSGTVSTVGHGLGATPDWIIFKQRTGTQGWIVWLGQTFNARSRLVLNGTNQVSTSQTNFMNDTLPSSSVFTIGNDADTNNGTDTYIAYCFTEKQGFSKFGTYVGNGNTDGTFVYTGFKPAWVMLKATDASKSWYMFDNKRPGFNEIDLMLLADTADTESSDAIDFLSNGFKLRTSGSGENGSGTNYVFMAFAESPFVNSNGVPNNAG